MANGNGNQAILDFLQRVERIETLTPKQRDGFILEGIGIMVRSQIARDAEWVAYKSAVDELKRRSFGLWVYNNPKSALFFSLLLYSFAISDIRQPVLAWLTEIVKLIL